MAARTRLRSIQPEARLNGVAQRVSVFSSDSRSLPSGPDAALGRTAPVLAAAGAAGMRQATLASVTAVRATADFMRMNTVAPAPVCPPNGVR